MRSHAMTDRRETWLLLSPGLALLVLAFLLPIARMLVLSVQGPDGYTLAHFAGSFRMRIIRWSCGERSPSPRSSR